ncbi:unnamed protein product [Clonostachys rosea f. rosea IK726]|uniref:Uncharacterized protein n=1 Tax=Clonostachys rosea f. rosea IK726 TaxID=1349383 RepID=A0ACA9TV10_BIOOC|nr:unnamed protein product [Clonostachys rosea f. rosea IK726]
MSWSSLPPELQIEVCRMLLEPESNSVSDAGIPDHMTRPRILSTCAVVCQGWQAYFEKENFIRLILHQDDVSRFGKILARHQRTSFVRWIWLRIELPTYDCSRCGTESTDEDVANKYIFTNAVWDLLGTLSTWPRNKEIEQERRGLTLELSVHSPSDTDHYCQDLSVRANDTAWSLHTPPPRVYKDKFHRWENGHPTRWVKNDALLRVFGHPRGLRFDLRAPSARRWRRVLPKVGVVKSFQIRRQFFRHFSVAKALVPMIESLNRLVRFEYESWRGIDTASFSGKNIRDEEHQELFEVLKSRRSLRFVSFFEDLNPTYHRRNQHKRADRTLGQTLARTSRNLECLHAAMGVDAQDFFFAFLPETTKPPRDMRWRNLEFLSLYTSQLTLQGQDRLLCAAALAAKVMPNIKIFELWTARPQQPCIFIYGLKKGGQPQISLDSSWAPDLAIKQKNYGLKKQNWITPGISWLSATGTLALGVSRPTFQSSIIWLRESSC